MFLNALNWEAGGGGSGCDGERSHRRLIYVLPATHRSPRPGVRLSALSIILALCGIPRIPRPPLLRRRYDAAASHLVQDQTGGHGGWQQSVRSQPSSVDHFAVTETEFGGGNAGRALHSPLQEITADMVFPQTVARMRSNMCVALSIHTGDYDNQCLIR